MEPIKSTVPPPTQYSGTLFFAAESHHRLHVFGRAGHDNRKRVIFRIHGALAEMREHIGAVVKTAELV